ncbi:MAG: CvpA family protein [Desulfobacteraceae bacterium]|nr:CvpA family protein [Desulfobacteraceae bacterium]
MNFFDIAILIIISFCLIRGVFRGILGELASIVGVVAGFYGAYTYYKEFTPLLEKYLANEALINIIIFFILFSLIFAFVAVIAVCLEKLLRVAFLGWIDKTFGAVFGAAKGVLIAAVIYIILTTFLPKNNTLISQSVLSPHVARVASVMTLFISNNMSKGFMEKIENMEKLWKS